VKAFTELYLALDETNSTGEKVEAMVRYFSQARPEDAAWAIYFLSGRKLRQAVPTKKLREWSREQAALPEWLFEESYHAVGDLAEAIALLLPPPTGVYERPLADLVEGDLLRLRELPEHDQRAVVLRAWSELDSGQRLVWNKLIMGSMRVGVSQLLVVRALARVAGAETDTISHRLMGEWKPTADFYRGLMSPDPSAGEVSRPYPFCLAHPLEGEPAELGPASEWQAEWKWDGIRSQVVRRAGQSFIWSRGEELVTDRYPELKALVETLPDGTVFDGEILPWKDGRVQPFSELQRRIGRKTIGKKLLEEIPVVLVAYDLIESSGVDLRDRPLSERRERLEALTRSVNHPALILSSCITFDNWESLAAERRSSRERGVEGMMLKRRSSPYRVGRVRGDWWKWKIEPFTADAVLIYAQSGHGKRGGLFTDYTFGIWSEGKLVPFAKAYSGLTDAEIREVDAFVRKNTVEKFGPVRTVKPELVFELGFEGIQLSSRHKSGIAVRFPRMLRWRTDKKPEDADSLEQVKALLARSSDGAEAETASEGPEVSGDPVPGAL
jgi:DNA ligase-1